MDGVELVADFGAFDVPGEADVAAAGDDEGCGAGVFGGIGRIDGEAGLADVGDTDGDFAGDDAVGVGGGVDLGADDFGGFGVAVGPEGEGWLLGRSGCGEKDWEQENWEQSHGSMLMQMVFMVQKMVF